VAERDDLVAGDNREQTTMKQQVLRAHGELRPHDGGGPMIIRPRDPSRPRA